MNDLPFADTTSTHPNVFGGMNGFDASGHMTGYSTPNVFGGTDFHDPAGHPGLSSTPNVFGGHDFLAAGQPVFSTHAGANGMDLTGAGGAHLGTLSSQGPALSFQDLQGHYSSWHQNVFGGYSADPLSSVGSIQFPSMTS